MINLSCCLRVPYSRGGGLYVTKLFIYVLRTREKACLVVNGSLVCFLPCYARSIQGRSTERHQPRSSHCVLEVSSSRLLFDWKQRSEWRVPRSISRNFVQHIHDIMLTYFTILSFYSSIYPLTSLPTSSSPTPHLIRPSHPSQHCRLQQKPAWPALAQHAGPVCLHPWLSHLTYSCLSGRATLATCIYF